ncbi:hypothetical protein [Mesorhizobium sp. NZP2298]|uniref:hypothetical protein n=1 Tax=Mesorhizobium sp. NZP2298 TaxID=2483403 RepID=UPI001557AEE6|nr:hypothetical protein [Mesorhizobium sp. NZP2298]QKC97274.1 hypothetical protein EB231_23260 [Mesorhizobium sp. NZP2298]
MAAIFPRPRKSAPVDVRPPRVVPKVDPEAYRVPSAAEVLPDLARLLERENEISAAVRADRAEQKLFERELAVDDSPEIHPEVAALLQDNPSPKATKRKAIADARHRIAVGETALAEIQKRRMALETKAGKAVCDAVGPEVGKRVAALVTALQAADEAHGELNELIMAIEAEGVSWASLGPIRPFFMGDHRDAQRRVATYVKDVTEAGYAV